MAEYYSLDRFEESVAICESDDEKILQVPYDDLPDDAREGDLLFLDADGVWQVDEEETEARRRKLCEKLAALRRKR